MNKGAIFNSADWAAILLFFAARLRRRRLPVAPLGTSGTLFIPSSSSALSLSSTPASGGRGDAKHLEARCGLTTSVRVRQTLG